jgi:hypothetical protein
LQGVLLLAGLAFALAGCGVAGLFGPSGGPYPEACAQFEFVPRQCKSMVTRAQSQAGVTTPDVVSVDILPPTQDNVARIGGYMISRVRLHLSSGTERIEEIWCIGILGGGDDACNLDPTIGIAAGPVSHDIPCTGDGDPPTGCATEPPTPRPEIQAMAKPLRVPVLDIPLEHLGPYEIEVGVAGLPDGAFSRSSASVVDQRPESFWIRDARLVIEPVDPARPPVGSIYREPFDGVEPVRVTLVFEVTELRPGAVLQVRDIVIE